MVEFVDQLKRTSLFELRLSCLWFRFGCSAQTAATRMFSRQVSRRRCGRPYELPSERHSACLEQVVRSQMRHLSSATLGFERLEKILFTSLHMRPKLCAGLVLRNLVSRTVLIECKRLRDSLPARDSSSRPLESTPICRSVELTVQRWR